LTAKYATTCGVCRAPISPGEQIAAVPSGSPGRWSHVACNQPSPQPAPAVGTAPAAPATGSPVIGPVISQVAVEPASDVEVYTDGACSGNPGPGGWAWATRDGRQGSGGEPQTTNQRMEITAALEAVRTLDDSPLVVVSDSTYVVNCFRDRWWQGWIERGWLTSARKPVANRDLWEPFVALVRERGDVRFRWVKGHSGDPMNDLVDRLAVEAGQSRAGR
jgi:ribonuclease HI